jgi:hypothetical protein
MPQSLMQSQEQRQGSQSCSQVPVFCVHSSLRLWQSGGFLGVSRRTDKKTSSWCRRNGVSLDV